MNRTFAKIRVAVTKQANKFLYPCVTRGQTAFPHTTKELEKLGFRFDYDGEVKRAGTIFHKFQVQPNAGKINKCIRLWRDENGGTHAIFGVVYVKKGGSEEDVTKGWDDMVRVFKGSISGEDLSYTAEAAGSGTGAKAEDITSTEWTWWNEERISSRRMNGVSEWKAPRSPKDSSWIYSKRERKHFIKCADGAVVWHSSKSNKVVLSSSFGGKKVVLSSPFKSNKVALSSFSRSNKVVLSNLSNSNMVVLSSSYTTKNMLISKALRCLIIPCGRDKQTSLGNQLRRYSNENMESRKIRITGDPPSSFFNFTLHRWLYNEHLRLPERRVYFDIGDLHHLLTKATGRSDTDLVTVTKLADGGSFRVFEATFRDGVKVILRIPYPCTIPRKYGVASEVATMEFLRIHGLPIPKILDWSSSASNQFGSEYIIMERASGRELAEIWYTTTMKERFKIMEKIVDVERLLFGIRFPASGSLFFKESLGPDIKSVDMPKDNSLKDVSKFCIGPSAEYLWWYQKRNELGADCGPWRSSEEVLKAVGEREILWLRRFGEKRHPRQVQYRGVYGDEKVDPQVQIQYLLDYLKVAPHLVPKEEHLNLPTIRHPDLSPNNIFISDSGDITAVIDWPNATILPIFLQAQIPEHFQNWGDDDSENFRPPKLAEDFANMTADEKKTAMERFRRQQMHYFYVGHTSDLNKAHLLAGGTTDLALRSHLYKTAGRPWEGDNTSLQAQLIKTMAQWSEIASPEENCPVRYSPEDVKKCLERNEKQNTANEFMREMRNFIRVDIDGLALDDDFESVKERARILKEVSLKEVDTDDDRKEINEFWPFQDHEEID